MKILKLGAAQSLMFMNAGPAEGLARYGRVKILGIGSAERVPLVPTVPTLREIGISERSAWVVLG